MFNEHSNRKVLVVIAYALVALAVEGALLITGVSSIDVNTTASAGEAMPDKPQQGQQTPQAQQGQQGQQTQSTTSVPGMSGDGTGTSTPGSKPPLGNQGYSN